MVPANGVLTNFPGDNLWEFHDEIMSVRFLCSLLHFLHRDVISSVFDVLRDGCPKQNWFLADHSNLLSQIFYVPVADINAVDQNLNKI